jgi:hypothetical protein
VIVRLGAIGMAVLLAVYLVFVATYAVRLMLSDTPIGVVMGIALFVLPVIGAWALFSELLFGVRAQRLHTLISADGDLPADGLPLRPSGRPERDAADEQFPIYKAAVEAEPGSWSAWFRLALAYDASGDRKRARWATREAIRLERATRRG